VTTAVPPIARAKTPERRLDPRYVGVELGDAIDAVLCVGVRRPSPGRTGLDRAGEREADREDDARRVPRLHRDDGIWHDSLPPDPDETVLRAKAREVIRTGKLPSRAPDRTWGGPGVGAPCVVCGEAVTKAQLEFEIEFARDGDNPGLDKIHVHIRCFAAWELERRQDGAHS